MSVYALRDPRDGRTRYVGRSRRPVLRFKSHVKRAHSERLRDWIEELRSSGLSPELALLGFPCERRRPGVRRDRARARSLRRSAGRRLLLPVLVLRRPRAMQPSRGHPGVHRAGTGGMQGMTTSDNGARPSFRLESTYELPGRGTMYTVKLDRDTDDFAHLLGQVVEIDGAPFLCRGVERFAIPIHRAGEMISLRADPIPVSVTVEPSLTTSDKPAPDIAEPPRRWEGQDHPAPWRWEDGYDESYEVGMLLDGNGDEVMSGCDIPGQINLPSRRARELIRAAPELSATLAKVTAEYRELVQRLLTPLEAAEAIAKTAVPEAEALLERIKEANGG